MLTRVTQLTARLVLTLEEVMGRASPHMKQAPLCVQRIAGRYSRPGCENVRRGPELSPKRPIIVVALALAVSLAGVHPALAAAGGGGGGGAGSSVTLALLDSADGLAHTGQQVTFTVSTSATTRPFVSLNCYQDGVWVYTASAGFFPDYPWSQAFTLSSSAWMSGAADCTARLYSTKDGTRTRTLATASFHVYP